MDTKLSKEGEALQAALDRWALRHFDPAHIRRCNQAQKENADLRNAYSQGRCRVAFSPLVEAIADSFPGSEMLDGRPSGQPSDLCHSFTIRGADGLIRRIIAKIATNVVILEDPAVVQPDVTIDTNPSRKEQS